MYSMICAVSFYIRGNFFFQVEELAMDGKYIGLREWHNQEHRARAAREWDNQEHRAASSSIPREQGKHVSICTLMMYSNDILFLYNLILQA